ncbi:hypothetical protein [Bradyrhizobium sp. CCBAU 53415]|uniref:hypothetical protein n=1 Tax=Bradyrhizobium sp. CCBAU 53415 TaxID=1325119 RepID=UPI0023068C0E|nr:hypothetical protein [Bradyrhizobium sp. CCBAU 53415]MDA9469203.1 hypothetical protein [Bradyrhizobium sp. CCBAU 53415]
MELMRLVTKHLKPHAPIGQAHQLKVPEKQQLPAGQASCKRQEAVAKAASPRYASTEQSVASAALKQL